MYYLFLEPSCPTSSNPNYKKISGSCIYFETSEKTHSDAKENCKSKFGPGSTGRLLEPRSSVMNQEVYDAARTLSQIDDDASVWLGITNFRDNSIFEYDSDSQAVISGLWESSQPNDQNNHHCVAVQETSGTVLGKHECCYQNFFFKVCFLRDCSKVQFVLQPRSALLVPLICLSIFAKRSWRVWAQESENV